MSKISGTWFKKWLEPKSPAPRIYVAAWAVVSTRTGEVVSTWDNETEAVVCAITGQVGEYRVAHLTERA